jgi:uncharacterized protein
MLQLSQINIFPVKSLDGYSPTSAIVEKRGLQYDRRWLITEPDGTFMTQRTNGRMALLRAVVADGFLRIEEKENPQNHLKIALDTEGGKKDNWQSAMGNQLWGDKHSKPSNAVKVQVWDDSIEAVRVSDEADAFLSDFLGKKCQLVTMPDWSERVLDPDYNTGGDIVSFADAYPFLIIGEASMRDLNERLDIPLSIRRFRTNFVFSGGQPFEEDDFGKFKIGDVDFIGLKRCARCVLTTRDPDTGQKGREPLHTLQTFRQRGTKIIFGENVVWNFKTWNWAYPPEVRVGDVIVKQEYN